MAELSRGQILKNPEVIGETTGSGIVKFWDGTETNYVSVMAPARMDASYNLTWPTTDGTVNQYLKSDGSGVLSWDTPSATAGGSNSQIQYNSSTALAGAAGLTTDGTHLTVQSAGEVRWADATGGEYVSFKSSATVAVNQTYTLPWTVGSIGQVLKISTSTAGTAVLAWANDEQGTGTTPGGDGNAVQYNFGGTFGGKSTFTFTSATDTLAVTRAVIGNVVISANAITSTSADIELNPVTAVSILQDKRLRLYDSDRSNFVGFSAPTSVTSNYTFTYPGSPGAVGSMLQFDASANGTFVSNQRIINFLIEEAGQAITTGVKGYVEVPFNCQVIQWSLLGDGTASGAAVVDVWRSTYAGFNPPTFPVSTASIAGSELPTITTNQQKGQDTSLTTWATVDGVVGGLIAGDILAFNVNSNTNFKKLTVALTLRLR